MSATTRLVTNATYTILPLHWGSRGIWLSDWISLFTLGLAPLVAHIIAGSTSPSYLVANRPRWHDRVCFLIPATILWRYAAITDRRIRSEVWTEVDMAASNAIFWTEEGWDGSEAMMSRCLDHAVFLPDKPTARLLSKATLNNLIAFAQGVQMLFVIIGNFTSTGTYTVMDCVNGIFIPIGILGALRLCAAPWLTDDYLFRRADTDTVKLDNPSNLESLSRRGIRSWSIDSLIDENHSDDIGSSITFVTRPLPLRNQRRWASRLFRLFYLIPIAGCFVVDFLFITPWVGIFGWVGIWSTTSWTLGMYYLVHLVPTLGLFTFYFSRGPIQSTIIPCISSWWYKIYSIFIIAFTVVLIIIASIETNETVCGKYTSVDPKYGDPCATGDLVVFHLKSGSIGDFAIAGMDRQDGKFTAINFTGSCLGVPGLEWEGQTIAP